MHDMSTHTLAPAYGRVMIYECVQKLYNSKVFLVTFACSLSAVAYRAPVPLFTSTGYRAPMARSRRATPGITYESSAAAVQQYRIIPKKSRPGDNVSFSNIITGCVVGVCCLAYPR